MIHERNIADRKEIMDLIEFIEKNDKIEQFKGILIYIKKQLKNNGTLDKQNILHLRSYKRGLIMHNIYLRSKK